MYPLQRFTFPLLEKTKIQQIATDVLSDLGLSPYLKELICLLLPLDSHSRKFSSPNERLILIEDLLALHKMMNMQKPFVYASSKKVLVTKLDAKTGAFFLYPTAYETKTTQLNIKTIWGKSSTGCMDLRWWLKRSYSAIDIAVLFDQNFFIDACINPDSTLFILNLKTDNLIIKKK